MKLFYSPGACSLAPHIALLETETAFEAVKVDLRSKEYSGGDYRSLNPRGIVPALQMADGQLLMEGAVILQWIADQKPQANWMPKAGTWERYRAQEWLNYIATELHKGFSPVFGRKNLVQSEEGQEQLFAAARESLQKKYSYVSEQLGARAYLMGDQVSVADAYLFTILRWSKVANLDLEQWPNLAKFMDRMRARPAVAKALEAEGLRH
jgi:glutathione S-transferase